MHYVGGTLTFFPAFTASRRVPLRALSLVIDASSDYKNDDQRLSGTHPSIAFSTAIAVGHARRLHSRDPRDAADRGHDVHGSPEQNAVS